MSVESIPAHQNEIMYFSTAKWISNTDVKMHIGKSLSAEMSLYTFNRKLSKILRKL